MKMPTCMNILETNPENSTKKRVKEEKYKETLEIPPEQKQRLNISTKYR